MKPLSELTHYEILELGREASVDELERAYQIARTSFAEDSLATYSVCPVEEAAAMRERIELAYRTLADPDSRVAYDEALGGEPMLAELDDGLLDPSLDEIAPAPELKPEIASFDDVEDDDVVAGGASLRRARLRHGHDLERIAAVTKINPTYLRFLEEEQFEDLPASVYVRGFLVAYARAVGVDPSRVVTPYMEKLKEARAPQPKGRRGRR